MKNKAILRLYFERIVLVVPGIVILAFLCLDNIYDEDYLPIFSNVSNTIYMLELIAIVFITWIFTSQLRSNSEINFVNALPVTKKQQFDMMFLVLSVCTVVMTAMIDLLHYMKRVASIMETALLGWIGSSIAKITFLLLVISMLIFIFTYVSVRLRGLIAGGMLFIIGYLSMNRFFTMVQIILGYEGNHPYKIIHNFWSILTIPRSEFRVAWLEGFQEYGLLAPLDSSRTFKIVIFIVYELVMLGITFLFFYFARKKFAGTDVAISHHRITKRVPRAVLILLSGIYMMFVTGAIGGTVLASQISYPYRDTDGYMEQLTIFDSLEPMYIDGWTQEIEIKGVMDFKGKIILWEDDEFGYRGYEMDSALISKILFIFILGGGVFLGFILCDVILKSIQKRERRQEKIDEEKINHTI